MAHGVRANYGVLSTFGVASDFGVLPQYGAGDGATLDAAFSAFASADYTPTADGVTTTAQTFTAKDANDVAVDGASVTFSLLPRFSVSASESGVGVSPSSIPDDGLTVAVVTATIEDAAGNPLANTETGAQVTCAVSGTGNTVTAQSTITDSLGRLFWNVVSTVPAEKTVTITAYGLGMSTTPTLTVTGEGAAPILTEDFSTYTDTADFIADPRGIYLTVEDFRTDQMTLDTGVGYGGLTQSLRYDYPSGTGTDYTISRMLDMPAAASDEVWVEAVVRWSADFTIAGNGQPAGNALKLMHVEVNGAAGRFAVNLEGSTARAEGPNDDYDDLYINPSPGVSVTTLFDGQPHIIRYHVQLGVTDFHEFSVDGVYQGQASGTTAATDFWGIALCRNLNKLAANAMEMWWHRVRVYDVDPGWSEFA